MLRRLVLVMILLGASGAYAQDPCSDRVFDQAPSEACIQRMDLMLRLAERVEVCLEAPVDLESEDWWAQFEVCKTAAHQAECGLDRCFPRPTR